MSIILNVRNVSKSIGGKKLLRSINFNIHEGETFGLIGPNGSGKTTLLKTLLGFYKPSEGNIFFKNKDISKCDYKNYIGFSSQDDSVYMDMTVEENLFYFGHLYGISNKELNNRVDVLIEMVDLNYARNKLYEKLSGGMQKRLDIACSLINDPELLILDEPFSGLDPKQREDIWALLSKIKESGTSVLLSSHFLEDLETFCDNIGLVVSGEMLFVGSPDELKKKYINNVKIIIKTYPFNLTGLRKVFPDSHIIANSLLFYVSYTELESRLMMIIKNLYSINEKITFLNVSEPSLDDLFRKVVENV